MAHTAHKTSEEVNEFREADDVLDAKAEQLAQLLLGSAYPVVWTGAGVSTSAGVPDFRGPNGKWTLKAQGKTRDPKLRTVAATMAMPSLTHMSLVKLLETGQVKKIISTNTDGLHRRSGVRAAQIAELHGNTNAMRCNKCGVFAYVDQRARVAAKVHSHETQQACLAPKCTGVMCDTIVNFGEYLLPGVQEDANAHGDKADCLLVLGSSLRVITCDALMSIQDKPKGKLVIVNLQKTPYDDACALRIWGDCDSVMRRVMDKMKLPVPDATLQRFFTVSRDPATNTVTVAGVTDETGATACAFIQKAELLAAAGAPLSSATLKPRALAKPLVMALPAAAAKAPTRAMSLALTLLTNRGEAPLVVPLPDQVLTSKTAATVCFTAVYSYSLKAWTLTCLTAAP